MDCWADPNTYDVVRLEMNADDFPVTLPLKEAITIIDYARNRLATNDRTSWRSSRPQGTARNHSTSGTESRLGSHYLEADRSSMHVLPRPAGRRFRDNIRTDHRSCAAPEMVQRLSKLGVIRRTDAGNLSCRNKCSKRCAVRYGMPAALSDGLQRLVLLKVRLD